MSKNWELYHSKVDHKPAYIFFDLEISKETNLSQYTYMAYVRLYLLAPNEDGLSTNDEYEKLCDIEDILERKLTENQSVYVGRNTSDGCRDFYFYIMEPSDWQQKVKLVMNNFPDYEYDVGEREDKNWDTYFNFLYPSTRDWETIKSRHVCDNITKEGDSLTNEREIDHWIYFKNILNREAFEKKVLSLGYLVRNQLEPQDSNYSTGLQVYHFDIPSPYITLELFDQAQEYDGDYDGWETQIIT